MRDILMQDFEMVEIVNFPSSGTTLTPQHDHGDFTFQSIAPLGMRFFRDIFDISVEGFLNSIAAEPLGEFLHENSLFNFIFNFYFSRNWKSGCIWISILGNSRR